MRLPFSLLFNALLGRSLPLPTRCLLLFCLFLCLSSQYFYFQKSISAHRGCSTELCTSWDTTIAGCMEHRSRPSIRRPTLNWHGPSPGIRHWLVFSSLHIKRAGLPFKMSLHLINKLVTPEALGEGKSLVFKVSRISLNKGKFLWVSKMMAKLVVVTSFLPC